MHKHLWNISLIYLFEQCIVCLYENILNWLSHISDATGILKRQSAPNGGGSFQAGGSPASASNQQPSLFVQPSTFTDPSFSAVSGGSQPSGSGSNGTSSSGSNPGASSPFIPSFLDPSKFSSTGQFSPNFAGMGGSATGSGPYPPGTTGTGAALYPGNAGAGAFPPGTSGSGGLFPLTVSGGQGGGSGNSTGLSPPGMTSSGTNSTAGNQQLMYPSMFSNPNQFVGWDYQTTCIYKLRMTITVDILLKFEGFIVNQYLQRAWNKAH